MAYGLKACSCHPLKGRLDKYLNYTIRKESFLSKALYIFKIGTFLTSIKCPGFVWEATPVNIL